MIQFSVILDQITFKSMQVDGAFIIKTMMIYLLIEKLIQHENCAFFLLLYVIIKPFLGFLLKETNS